MSEIWRRDEIESPCKKICMILPRTGTCVGCFRTMDEIARWSTMTPEARAEVMGALPEREKEATKRSGGRKNRLDRPRRDGR